MTDRPPTGDPGSRLLEEARAATDDANAAALRTILEGLLGEAEVSGARTITIGVGTAKLLLERL